MDSRDTQENVEYSLQNRDASQENQNGRVYKTQNSGQSQQGIDKEGSQQDNKSFSFNQLNDPSQRQVGISQIYNTYNIFSSYLAKQIYNQPENQRNRPQNQGAQQSEQQDQQEQYGDLPRASGDQAVNQHRENSSHNDKEMPQAASHIRRAQSQENVKSPRIVERRRSQMRQDSDNNQTIYRTSSADSFINFLLDVDKQGGHSEGEAEGQSGEPNSQQYQIVNKNNKGYMYKGIQNEFPGGSSQCKSHVESMPQSIQDLASPKNLQQDQQNSKMRHTLNGSKKSSEGNSSRSPSRQGLETDQDRSKFYQKVCPVCIERLQKGELVKQLPCGHLFHPHCIDKWFLQNKKDCPNCREQVSQKK